MSNNSKSSVRHTQRIDAVSECKQTPINMCSFDHTFARILSLRGSFWSGQIDHVELAQANFLGVSSHLIRLLYIDLEQWENVSFILLLPSFKVCFHCQGEIYFNFVPVLTLTLNNNNIITSLIYSKSNYYIRIYLKYISKAIV